MFVAHFDAGITPRRQTLLWDQLKARYGEGAIALRRLVLEAGVPRPVFTGCPSIEPERSRFMGEPTGKERETSMLAAVVWIAAAACAIIAAVINGAVLGNSASTIAMGGAAVVFLGVGLVFASRTKG
ncbi:MAG: hypothetical protein MSC31_17105 [Solirubrobacteraceae bacterium MAG38_C4-C5]|nr:hypothetical protein [Candidatus Siliceabacter maunaloa]